MVYFIFLFIDMQNTSEITGRFLNRFHLGFFEFCNTWSELHLFISSYPSSRFSIRSCCRIFGGQRGRGCTGEFLADIKFIISEIRGYYL
jgi:hypothetical protein